MKVRSGTFSLGGCRLATKTCDFISKVGEMPLRLMMDLGGQAIRLWSVDSGFCLNVTHISEEVEAKLLGEQ